MLEIESLRLNSNRGEISKLRKLYKFYTSNLSRGCNIAPHLRSIIIPFYAPVRSGRLQGIFTSFKKLKKRF